MLKSTHSIINFSDLAPRKVLNRVAYPFVKKEIDDLHRITSAIDVKSDEYCEAMAAYADRFLQGKELLCNFEEPILNKIAQSDMPVIYVMNHSKQTRDPSMLMLFNGILNVKYLELGKAATSPRPKIIMNQNIIKSQCSKMQDIYERCGAIGVDITSDKPNNTRALISVIKGYLSGDTNIFIFPEGRNCVKQYLPFEERFQDGVSGIIKRITEMGKTVKVVPLGFSYGKDKKLLGSMYIGKPMYFKKSGQEILISSANADSEFASEKLKQSFGKRFITRISGIKEISEQIIENMKICMSEANKRLLNPDNTPL